MKPESISIGQFPEQEEATRENFLARYSGCAYAGMSLEIADNHMVTEVRNNGHGLDQADLRHSGGLKNMQHHAAEMKAGCLWPLAEATARASSCERRCSKPVLLHFIESGPLLAAGSV